MRPLSRRRSARAWRALAIVALALPAARGEAAAADFPAQSARIDITIVDATTATVWETYEPVADDNDAGFELLDEPCSTVGPVAFRSESGALTYQPSKRGPWTLLHVNIHASDFLQVEYQVRFDGTDASVPIAVPSAPLRSQPQSRGALVTLRVAFDASTKEGSIVLPRFEPDGSGGWTAHMLAIPSSVRVRLPADRPSTCGRILAGSTGGLEWRFWIFVATMATWIPIYFWLFGRKDA